MKNTNREFRLALQIFASLLSFAALAWFLRDHSSLGQPRFWLKVPCGVMLFSAGVVFCTGVVLMLRSLEKKGFSVHRKRGRVEDSEVLVRRAEKEIRKREAKAEQFLEACTEIFDMSELKDIGEAVLRVAEKTLGADQGSVLLLDDSDHLGVLASRGLSERVAQSVHLQLGERVAGLSAFERKEFLINGDLGNYPLFKDLEGNPLIRSAMICPILYRTEVVGVLNLSRTLKSEPEFTHEDLRTAMVLARQVGLALHHARMCERLKNSTDELKKTYRELKESRLELLEFEKQNNPFSTRRMKAS